MWKWEAAKTRGNLGGKPLLDEATDSVKQTVYSSKSCALSIKFNMGNAVIWFIGLKCFANKVKPP